jgi:hypothetical protein
VKSHRVQRNSPEDAADRERPVLRRVTRALTHSEEYPLAQASRLSSRFRLAHPVEVHDFPEKGNINQHTYLVFAGMPRPQEFFLQRINGWVFTRPRSVMRAMVACIEAQRASMAAARSRRWVKVAPL